MCMQFKEIFPLKQNIGEINFFLIFLKSLTFWRVARENHGFHSFKPTYIYIVSNDQIGMLYNLKYVVKWEKSSCYNNILLRLDWNLRIW